MLKKKLFPEEGELVICKVTSVQSHSVFAQIKNYNKSGMIHISEVSPGRIRNIRDYVKEGKIIVTKVLRINQERGHIDLSLRRVTDNQRRIVITQDKQEAKARKIIDYLASEMKQDPQKLFEQIATPVSEHYDYLFDAFMEVVEDNTTFEELGVPKDVAKKLDDVVKQRIKPAEVEIKGTLSLSTFAPDGLETVKKALHSAEKEGSNVSYLGGGNYLVRVKAPDYKKAEKILADSTNAAVSLIEKSGGQGTFERAQ